MSAPSARARRPPGSRPPMVTVMRIIEKHGGLRALSRRPIRIENPPQAPLLIQNLGKISAHCPGVVSVAHLRPEDGVLKRVPEVVFLVDHDGTWRSLTYQHDGNKVFLEAMYERGGRVVVRPRVRRELLALVRDWDAHLRVQGFMDVADVKRMGGVSGMTPKPSQGHAGTVQ